MDDYSDIIDLSRPISKRQHMSLYQRSAQFAPFAALTGYEGQVKEAARLTNKRIEINEEIKFVLDMKLQVIQNKIINKPLLTITYFVPDENKNGGQYLTIQNNVKKIDIYNNQIIMINDMRISIDEIIDMQCELFNGIYF